VPPRRERGLGLLTDPTRRQIIALLAVRPSRSTTVATTLGLSRSAASRHLRLLDDAGLVTGHRSMIDGRGVLYTINSWSRGAILAFLAGTDLGALPRHTWAADQVEHLFPPLARRSRRRRDEPDDDIDWQRFG
jgi:DNA-binding transcriptional ArsR family regulator